MYGGGSILAHSPQGSDRCFVENGWAAARIGEMECGEEWCDLRVVGHGDAAAVS